MAPSSIADGENKAGKRNQLTGTWKDHLQHGRDLRGFP